MFVRRLDLGWLRTQVSHLLGDGGSDAYEEDFCGADTSTPSANERWRNRTPDLLRSFRLPPFATLAEEAKGREEVVTDQVSGGAVIEGAYGVIGKNVGIGMRQTRFWLPADHPRFGHFSQALDDAIRASRDVQVCLDPHSHILLDVTVP